MANGIEDGAIFGKGQIHYKSDAGGVFGNLDCGNCKHHVPKAALTDKPSWDGGCEQVIGNINPAGICDLVQTSDGATLGKVFPTTGEQQLPPDVTS